MRRFYAIFFVLLLTACSSDKPTAALSATETAPKIPRELLDYGEPAIQQYYTPAPAGHTYDFNGKRIAVARIGHGRFDDLNVHGNRPLAGVGGNIVHGWKGLQDHAPQVTGWSQFAAAGTNRSLDYIFDPGIKYESNYSNPPANFFSKTLQYLQSAGAAHNFDYLIVYETSLIFLGREATTIGKGAQGIAKATNNALFPIGAVAMGLTLPFAHEKRNYTGYTDAFIIDLHARTYRKYHGLTDPQSSSPSPLAIMHDNKDFSTAGKESLAEMATANQSFQTFLTTIEAGQ